MKGSKNKLIKNPQDLGKPDSRLSHKLPSNLCLRGKNPCMLQILHLVLKVIQLSQSWLRIQIM